MKVFLLILFMAFASPNDNGSSRIEDCKCKGKRLAGKVFITNSKYDNVDFIVFKDSENPDFRVTRTGWFSHFECGQWHFTKLRGNADFTIFITDNRYEADFTIDIKDY